MTQAELDAEKKVLRDLERQYQAALKDIDDKVAQLLGRSDADMQNVIYQVEHQKALRSQIHGILEQLQANEFQTISDFLSASYQQSFVGTMYSMHNQGIPLILPVDKNAMVKAVTTNSRLSEDLYTALGVDIKKLNNAVRSEISRGISAGLSYNEIARNIANASKAPRSRAATIVRTESHRIREESRNDARDMAKKKGADVVKQWDATLDGDTRKSHRKLDGQIREVDEPFEVDGKKAMYPGDFGRPEEDINCRCISLTRARWELDEAELETLKKRAEFFGLDKSENFAEYEKKYLNSIEKIAENGIIDLGNGTIIDADDMAAIESAVKEYFGADARDKLDEIVVRNTTRIQQGFSAYSKSDVLHERTMLTNPDGDKFDVAMHGMPTAVAFGGKKANMSPRLLASVIRHNPNYNGQAIRLLACSTGKSQGDDYCFAEELANALGVNVYAPNDLIFFRKDGTFYIGVKKDGDMVTFKPNERRRFK